jgi:hypothetical protein
MNASESTGRRSDEVPVNGTVDKSHQTPAEIESEIEQQREELAETLDALGAKLDVKAQAQAKAQEVRTTTQLKVAEFKDRATTDTGQPRPEVLGAAVVLVVGTVALIWWRRSR